MDNMQEIVSPILIYGDHFTAQNNINAIKAKYENSYEWNVLSATNDSLEKIEAISISQGFIPCPKIVVITDFPNQKAFREFVLELVAKKNLEYTKFIIWDSSDSIKLDPKTKLPNKTWDEFIAKFDSIDGSKVVNCGAEFTEKDEDAIISFIKARFNKYKRTISEDTAKIFISIVGKDRGLITSEIDKMSFASPETITNAFIIENAFPSAKEAVLFKFNNVLDGSYAESIEILEQFLEAGINENVLAEIMAKKVRWQLAACHYYSKGMAWFDVEKNLMNMGKFPSVAWHHPTMDYGKKQKFTEECETEEGIDKFRKRILGLPDYCFDIKESKKSKKSKVEDVEEDGEEKSEKAAKAKKKVILGKKECLPMPFLATQIVSGLQESLVKPNSSTMKPDEIRIKMLDRAINVYLSVVDKLKEIRYGEDPKQCVYEMVKVITDKEL